MNAKPITLALLLIVTAHNAVAQQAVTRSDAERAALAGGTRIALARADTAASLARILSARALPNPTLAASYSKSEPQKHVSLEIPIFDALWTRSARLGQANASARASRLLFVSERTAAFIEIDTTYTRALATDARFRLSRQTARDADSLRKMTITRRDAGDASDLDVDLATVVAGQQLNAASDDSLTYMSALLTVQFLMGMSADSSSIILADSLTLTRADTSALAASDPSATGVPSVAAAQAMLDAADAGIALQRRGVFNLPSLSVGFEFGDQASPGLLPTIGFAIPLPLFNRNQGPIAEAQAERERARIQLLAAKLDVRRRVNEGVRERAALLARIVRDGDLVARAQRVAARSLTAYREGAAALPAVLEAQRSAREVMSKYIDDLAALLTVNTELRALTQTAPVP